MRCHPTPAAVVLMVSACCVVALTVSVDALAFPPLARTLNPIWVEAAPPPDSAPLGSALPSLAGDPAPDPLDAAWVGMSLPTLHNLVTPSGSVEFGGRLILAGSFTSAGAASAHTIAAWDGAVFGSMGDPHFFAQSLVVWNGVLYAGGTQGSQGYVSRWDGTAWHTIGTASVVSGGAPLIQAMEVFNGDLIVAGRFIQMDGLPALNVARFDGTTWHALGAGLTTIGSANIYDLQSVGSVLYVGGDMSGFIKRWDGTSWLDVGPGFAGRVRSLTTDGTNLYAAGEFSKAGTDSIPGVGKWNGAQWQRVGLGTAPTVQAILWWNGQLVAGVRDGTNRVSRFDGTNWSGLGGPFASNNAVLYLSTFGTKLVALGFVLPVPSGDAVSGAVFDGSTWASLREAWAPGMNGVDRGTYSATVWNDRLVVAGDYTRVGTGADMTRYSYESMWNGSAWTPIGTGVGAGPQPYYATTWGAELVVTGWVSATVPGAPGSRSAAHWNGSAWQVFDPGMFPYTYAAAEHVGELYVGGAFSETDGPVPVTLNHVARWTGSDWAALGSGLTFAGDPAISLALTLADWNGQLAAGGDFDMAGGQPASNVALWNGTSWSAAGGGLDGLCYALRSWGGVLVAGGPFAHAGGISASGAAFWDGASWHAMGDAAISVDDFAEVNGTLYAVGEFRHLDGTVSNTVARWTGTNWALLGSGAPTLSNALSWIEAYHGDLYAGGSVSFAFGKATAGIIRLPGANNVGVGESARVARVALAAAPNPSHGLTWFSFALPTAGRAQLAVFDAAGRVVATLVDGEVLPGRHQVRWSAPAGAGVYFARLQSPTGVKTTRFVLLGR